MATRFDTVVKNARLARPNRDGLEALDIGIKDGKVAEVAPDLPPSDGATVIDATGLIAFPGALDSHTHIGIYQHPSIDAPTETASAVSGGCTTMITYARTGSLYLNRPGPLQEFMPELLAAVEGRCYCDYGFHISPMSGDQVGQMEYLLIDIGAPNYGEVFMFYGSHGLHGRSDSQFRWLMLNEGDSYDLAHFDFICREAARLQDKYPHLAPYIQVSFHCETPELLRAYEPLVRNAGELDGLRAYSAARPPHSEALAIAQVGALAHAAGLKRVNILHITSREAMEAAMAVRLAYPDVDFGLEVTGAHLLIDYDTPNGVHAKVNPPIRSRENVEYLWEKMKDGTIQWVVTDHACCPADQKVNPDDPNDIWGAKAGFGGVEFLLPGVYSEGTKRGLSPNRIAELLSWNPTRRCGVLTKGDIAPGYDADIALLDPNEEWTIRAANSLSAQGYTPFEGLHVKGKVKTTLVRGQIVYANGATVGDPIGRYIKRPTNPV